MQSLGENKGPEKSFRSEYSCLSCMYFKNRLIRSGRNPIREYSCTSPDMNNKDNTLAISREDYYLLDSFETPKECPYLPSKIREDKINNIMKDDNSHI